MVLEDIIDIYNNCNLPLKTISQKHKSYSINNLKKLKSDFTKFKINEKENLEFIYNNLDMYTSYFEDYFKLQKGSMNKILLVFNIKLYRARPNDFTKREIEFVINNYKKIGPSACAKELDTSTKRIIALASKLEIKCMASEYSDEEKTTIRTMADEGYSPQEIALRLDRSISGIQNYIYKNDITYNYSKSSSNRFIPSCQELYVIQKFRELFNINFPDKTDINNKDYYWNIVGKYEIDLPIYINNLKFAIEYDGQYWHNPEYDKKKEEALTQAGFIVFRIKGQNNTHRNFHSLDKECEKIYMQITDLVKHFELTGTPLEPNTPN